MPSANDVIEQLGATRKAASASNDASNNTLNDEIAQAISDPNILAACYDIITKNSATIQQCDQHIVAAILARDDVEDWMTTLVTLTQTLVQQSNELKREIDSLNALKTTAAALAGLLTVLG